MGAARALLGGWLPAAREGIPREWFVIASDAPRTRVGIDRRDGAANSRRSSEARDITAVQAVWEISVKPLARQRLGSY